MIDGLPRVARVLDEFTVVLNRGERDGLQVNDKFLVFGLGEDIVDPDTGDNLGAIELVRGRVRIVHLQEKVATARTSETIKIPGRKRKIERSSAFTLALGKGTEEIEEDHSYEDKPLEGAMLGDYARLY